MDNRDRAYYLVLEPPMEFFLQRHRTAPDEPLARLAHIADEAKWAYLSFTVESAGDEDEDARLRDRWLRLRQRFATALAKS